MIKINNSKNGWRVQIVADNGEILQTSEELETKQAVLKHVVSMCRHISYATNWRGQRLDCITVRTECKIIASPHKIVHEQGVEITILPF